MKKNIKLIIGSLCTLGMISGFVLVKEGYEKATVKDVIGYYAEGKHEPNIKCRLKDNAYDDEILTIDDLVYYDFIPEGYQVTNITFDTNSSYAIVSYKNTEDVININDGIDLGITTSHFSSEFVRLAKKRCSK